MDLTSDKISLNSARKPLATAAAVTAVAAVLLSGGGTLTPASAVGPGFECVDEFSSTANGQHEREFRYGVRHECSL